MAIEIERKFLVADGFSPEKIAERHEKIAQGYLSATQNATVRVRTKGEKAFLTVKGKTIGDARREYEYEIPVHDAEEMFVLCPRVIEKVRYFIPYVGFLWEVDIFHGDDEGLIVAEIELPAEGTPFDRPDWVTEDVTGDPRYTNAVLSKHPFSTWRG